MTGTDNFNPEDGTQETHTNVVALPTVQEMPAHKKVVNFAQEHPVMTVAGGLAIGALAAVIIPKRNRTYIAKRSSRFADVVSAASVALIQHAMEKADAASAQVRSRAAHLAGQAEQFGHATKERVEKIGGASVDKAHALLGKTSQEPSLPEKIVSAANDLRDRLQR